MKKEKFRKRNWKTLLCSGLYVPV